MEEEKTTEIRVRAMSTTTTSTIMKCPFCEVEDDSVENLEVHVNSHFPSNVLQSELFKNVVKDTLAKQAAG